MKIFCTWIWRACVLDKAFVPHKVNYHTNLDFKLPSRVATSPMHMQLLAHIPIYLSLETEIMAVLWVGLLCKPCTAPQSCHTKGNQSHRLLLTAIHYFICLKQPVLDKKKGGGGCHSTVKAQCIRLSFYTGLLTVLLSTSNV